MMKELALADTIAVETFHGPCEINLNFGSVTRLQRERKVDVVVVSAFKDSYPPNPASVIGAIEKDLRISVAKLAQDKEEDLRSFFSCWWSKPLPQECIFKRVLCFEESFKREVRSPMVVSQVFRALVSLSKDTDIKVMMPLLAARDKDYSHQTMLRLTVEAAIHWMKIGLPLKVLEIVIFTRYENEIEESPLLPYFKDLKENWKETWTKEQEQSQEHPIIYDVYLSYSIKDQPIADTVKEKLKEIHSSIRIYFEHQNLNPNECWQEDLYQVMSSCARVITILSPRFLMDEACLEQYNIALCCTRNMKRDYLAPFYVASIDVMPTHMCLIQYIDCRPLDDEKISQACQGVTNWLQKHTSELEHLSCETKSVLSFEKAKTDARYDVFISYSHQNSEHAQRIENHLSSLRPDWNIFLDVVVLQTGTAWQIKLYNSIESSRIVIALLSPAYIKSKVCQEEYNLASAMHSDYAYDTKVVTVIIETVERLPMWCRGEAPIDCRYMSERELSRIVEKIELFKALEQLTKPTITSLEDITSIWRTEHITNGLKFFSNINMPELLQLSPGEKRIPDSSSSVDIVVSFHSSDDVLGKFLVSRLNHYLPNASVSSPDESQVRHSCLDEAKIIVPLLSKEFTKSAVLSEELNIALCRQRACADLVLFSVALESLPTTPAYFRLLWVLLCCTDKFWKNYKDKNQQFTNSEKCLDFAARMIAYQVTNPELFKGSYKTLLSVEELKETTLRLRAKKEIYLIEYNPLYFAV